MFGDFVKHFNLLVAPEHRVSDETVANTKEV